MLPDKIGALIIKDKALLLVTGRTAGSYAGFYWTPGGKIHEGETHQQCLARELEEELHVKPLSMTFFASHVYFHEDRKDMQTIHYYFVEIEGEPQPDEEISAYAWYTQGCNLKTTKVLAEQTIPALMKKGVL
jgi:8-oxo-dGTP diphosphatase